MNYQKLDAALTLAVNAAVDPDDRCFTVFLQLGDRLDDGAIAQLTAMNLAHLQPGQLGTATLSTHQIEALSEQSWVSWLRLSQTLRPNLDLR
jgi:hypothetical protein